LSRYTKKQPIEETFGMNLYIVRHGIAIDREDPKCPSDPERYLTEEGLKKTREVARGFAILAEVPKLFLSSPYVRALQTAEIFAEALKFSKSKIEKSEFLLPGSEPAAFFRELSHRKSVQSVVCFGHAPHLDELIAFALGSKRDLTELKKAGAASLELSRVHPPAGTLMWLMPPKALRNLSKGK
jgi:phosphohistidine phosphatase